MFSNYFQNHSGKIAQTYLLASKVKSKLTKEAVKHDVNLHKLVCQANLLDTLIENLNIYESSNNTNNNNNNKTATVSYDTIYSSPYPLLNNMINDSNENADDFNAAIDISATNDNNDMYYNSDASDFDSDTDNDDEDDDDDDDDDDDVDDGENNNDYYFNQQNSKIAFTDKECSGDLCCLALQRLNIKSGVNDEQDDFDTHDNIYDAEFSIHHTTISFSDSESESDDEYESVKPSCYYENENCLMRMKSKQTPVSDIANTATMTTNSSNNEDDDFPSLSSCSSVSSDESCQTYQSVKIESIHNDLKKKNIDLYSTNNNQSEENLFVF